MKSMTRIFSAVIMIVFLSVFLSENAFASDLTIRAALLMNQKSVRIQCRKALSVKDACSLSEIAPRSCDNIVKIYNGTIYVNRTPVNSRYVYVLSDDFKTPVSLNGVPYRGYFLIAANDQGGLITINCVGLEYYLGGVLGGEICASWPLEAIKAQAVAARTYVLFKMKNSGDRLYDVVNNTGDQMYVGVRGESTRFTRAISETAGQALVDNDGVICAYYHSNCGGHTSDSKDAFPRGGENLCGVRDPFCLGSPNSSWNIGLSSESVRLRLSRYYQGVGRIYSLKPLERDESGRILSLEIAHSGGRLRIPGAEFRKCIGIRDIKSSRFDVYPVASVAYRYSRKNSARSRISDLGNGCYGNVSEVPDSGIAPDKFVFSGRGWGHGVGMCQWGARGMALAGYKYTQILKYYYPKTNLGLAHK